MARSLQLPDAQWTVRSIVSPSHLPTTLASTELVLTPLEVTYGKNAFKVEEIGILKNVAMFVLCKWRF